jgi:anti-sigma factor RsiW
MSLPDQNKLADAIRRGKFSVGEEAQVQAYLANHPEDRASWEEDLSLNQLLRQAPDAPISSNFTARVLQMARATQRQAGGTKRAWRHWLLDGWIPKVATAAVIMGIGLLSYHQHQLTARREMARTLATMATAGNSLELLQNFDAIQRLTQVPPDVDRDLIAALQ